MTSAYKTGIGDAEITTTHMETRVVPRARTVAEEEQMPEAKRNVALASCYTIAYDTLQVQTRAPPTLTLVQVLLLGTARSSVGRGVVGDLWRVVG